MFSVLFCDEFLQLFLLREYRVLFSILLIYFMIFWCNGQKRNGAFCDSVNLFCDWCNGQKRNGVVVFAVLDDLNEIMSLNFENGSLTREE